MLRSTLITAAMTGALIALPAAAQEAGSATAGTGGSAAAGTTSASSLGLGGTSIGADGTTSSVLGTGASAAGAEGANIHTRTHVNENPNGVQGRSRAQSVDQGTFSRSQTRTRVTSGEQVTSTTRTMSHEPGEKPVKSTTTTTEPVTPAPAP